MRASSYIAALLGCCTLVSPAVAAERWVTPQGSGNACTVAQPCGTIAAAAAMANNGDVINVVGNLALEPFKTSKNGLKYRCTDAAGAYKRWGCKIQPENGTDNEATLWTNSGQDVEIRGFEMDGRTPDGRTSVRNVAYSSPTGTSPVTYIGNHVHHAYQRACSAGGAGLISDSYTAPNAVVNFDSNWVHDIASAHCNQVQGIYLSTNGYARNNIAIANGGWGIHTWHDAKDNPIENNIACGNRSGNITVGSGEYYHAAKPWTGTVQNNIVCDGEYGINVYGDIAAGQKFANNLSSNNKTAFNLKGNPCSGCITAQVRFVDAAAGDYHLVAGSPGIDQGTPVPDVKTDYEGTPRPQSGAYDIGAYEYKAGGNGGSGGTTPPNPTPSPGAGNAQLIYVPPTACTNMPPGALYNSAGVAKFCP